MNVKEE